MQVKTKYGLFVGSAEDYKAFEAEMARREGKTEEPKQKEEKPVSATKTVRNTAKKTTAKK